MSEPESINKVDLFGNEVNVAFNLIYPVGVAYTQYPGLPSPMDLWGEFSTWEVVKYGGAFFRTEGGNAKSFEQCSINVVTSDKLNFTFSAGNPGAWAVGDHVIAEGEERTIAAAIGNGFRVNQAFTTSKNITNVTVLQNDQNKLHNHSISHTHTRGTMNITGKAIMGDESSDMWDAFYQGGQQSGRGNEANGHISKGYTINLDASRNWTGSTSEPSNKNSGDTGGTESRPLNSTYRIWLRTA